jgi:DNA-binding winged helix-turn-helix (wHTH) protein
MLPPPITSRLIHFETFAVDPKSRELFSHGLRIVLQEQPFRVLLMLLEHCGDIVTREELRKALWPGDTFVDFDQGLNKAINKLRSALGDSAERPRYIETLPKRGYRLLVGVDPPHETVQFSKGLNVPGLQTTPNNRTSGTVTNSHGWGKPVAIGRAVLRSILSAFSREFPAMPMSDLPDRRAEVLKSAEVRKY